jgi:hypothetical protein
MNTANCFIDGLSSSLKTSISARGEQTKAEKWLGFIITTSEVWPKL